jgi:hypothetical protein
VTTGHHEGDDVGCDQAFEIQRATVSGESSLNERARHAEVGARRDSRQSALDGQVTPESIEHYVDRTQDCVGRPRNDLKPLKIFKHGAHRPDRRISGAAGGPTMAQETIQAASSQIRVVRGGVRCARVHPSLLFNTSTTIIHPIFAEDPALQRIAYHSQGVAMMVAVDAVPLIAVFRAYAPVAAEIGSLAVPTTSLMKLINLADSMEDALET